MEIIIILIILYLICGIFTLDGFMHTYPEVWKQDLGKIQADTPGVKPNTVKRFFQATVILIWPITLYELMKYDNRPNQ